MTNTTSRTGDGDATTGDQEDARAQNVDEPRTPASGPAGAPGVRRRAHHRIPRWAAMLTIVAIVGAGWVVLELSRAAQDDALPDTAESNDPIREYRPDLRGDPVQLAGNTLTDEPFDIVDLRGHVVVINVWGSWCVPCREEAPVLARMSREYAEQGVRFVGVNVKDNRAAALAFNERFGIPYPSIEDRDGSALLALNQHVPLQAVPVTLVLDTDGRVAARVIGLVREATLRALLVSALSSSEDPVP